MTDPVPVPVIVLSVPVSLISLTIDFLSGPLAFPGEAFLANFITRWGQAGAAGTREAVPRREVPRECGQAEGDRSKAKARAVRSAAEVAFLEVITFYGNKKRRSHHQT